MEGEEWRERKVTKSDTVHIVYRTITNSVVGARPVSIVHTQGDVSGVQWSCNSTSCLVYTLYHTPQINSLKTLTTAAELLFPAGLYAKHWQTPESSSTALGTESSGPVMNTSSWSALKTHSLITSVIIVTSTQLSVCNGLVQSSFAASAVFTACSTKPCSADFCTTSDEHYLGEWAELV